LRRRLRRRCGVFVRVDAVQSSDELLYASSECVDDRVAAFRSSSREQPEGYRETAG